MKQYVIDELTESDYYRIQDFFDEHLQKTAIDGIYWVDLPEHLYSDVQSQHSQCKPFYFAVNLSRKQVCFEWLIRSRETLHCECIAYANPTQRDYIIRYADGIAEQLELRV